MNPGRHEASVPEPDAHGPRADRRLSRGTLTSPVPVAEALGEVCRADGLGALEVGDGPRHLDDPVGGAGAQAQVS